MKQQKIRDVYSCRIEALTPVHVGSGESMKRGFDFFILKGKIHLVSADRLMREVEKLGTEKIDEFTRAVEERGADKWIERQGVHVDRISTTSFPVPPGKTPAEIRSQIKDGFNRPYLPGSSIKGALRTAIVRKLARENNTRIRKGGGGPKFADRQVCSELLGRDAKMNLMRSLSVGDFVVPREETSLFLVWVNRLTSPTNFAGKFPLCIEGTKNNFSSSGTISIDRFLSDKDKEKKCFNFKAHLDLDWLISACRELSNHTISTELEFFKDKTGKPVKDIISFYEDLRKKQQGLKDNEVIIQMAWGAGWRGMTGQLLEASDLDGKTRDDLKLAPKYKAFPFPKSRRIVTVNGQDLPMGWIKISFMSKEELVRREKEEKVRAEARAAEEEKQRKAAQIANAAHALEVFKQQVTSCANLPGEIDGFIQRINQLKRIEDKKEICLELLKKGNSLGKKKKFTKALKNEKNWAVKLKKLCEENGIDLQSDE